MGHIVTRGHHTPTPSTCHDKDVLTVILKCAELMMPKGNELSSDDANYTAAMAAILKRPDSDTAVTAAEIGRHACPAIRIPTLRTGSRD